MGDLGKEEQEQQDVVEIGGNECADRREQRKADPAQIQGRPRGNSRLSESKKGNEISQGIAFTMLEDYGEPDHQNKRDFFCKRSRSVIESRSRDGDGRG
ncbi:MAG: hypothetical protein ACKOBY_01430 [Cyanobium sp.]